MTRVLVFIFFFVNQFWVAQAFEGTAHPLEGRWQGSGEPMDLFMWQEHLVSSMQKDTTSYVFSFNPQSLMGELKTYEAKYGCQLLNGPSQIKVKSLNHIELFFNRIEFDVIETYVPTQNFRPWPRFCNYGLGPIFCGWENQKFPYSRQCEIKFRQPLRVDLFRKPSAE